MAPRLTLDLEPYASFVLKTVGGAIGFLVVFYVAVGLNLSVRWTERILEIPQWLTASVDWLERLLWAADVVGLASFIVRELVESVRGMWWRRKVDG